MFSGIPRAGHLPGRGSPALQPFRGVVAGLALGFGLISVLVALSVVGPTDRQIYPDSRRPKCRSSIASSDGSYWQLLAAGERGYPKWQQRWMDSASWT